MKRALIASTFALALTGAVGCDDSDAPKPMPPPPDVEVMLHAHFGRPGATLGQALRGVGAERNVQAVLAETTGLPAELVGLADLLQPADLVVAKLGETSFRVTSFSPVPNLASVIPEGYRYQATPAPAVVIDKDGKPRCLHANERLTCTPGDAPAVDLARAVRKRVARWAQDRTDAVVEIEGPYLRSTVLPALRQPLGDVERRLLGLVKRENPFAAGVEGGAVKAAGAWLSELERAVFRVRLDGRKSALEGRLEWVAAGKSEGVAATAALHGVAPLTTHLAHLPHGLHSVLADGRRVVNKGNAGHAFLALRRAATDPKGEASWASLQKLTAALAPGYAVGYGRAPEGGFVVEIYRARDPAAATAALAGLKGAPGLTPPIRLLPQGARRRLESGDLTILIGLEEDRLTVLSSRALPPDGLQQLLEAGASGDGASTSGLARTLAPYSFGVGVSFPALFGQGDLDMDGKDGGQVTFGYRVPDRSPRSLRSAFRLEMSARGLASLADLAQKDPPLPRPVVDEDGSER